ncbi:hypothetical protein JPSP39_02370 [Staphylococcus pseudintermedius]
MKIAALNCGIEIRLFFVHLHSIMCSFFFRYEMYEMRELLPHSQPWYDILKKLHNKNASCHIKLNALHQ